MGTPRLDQYALHQRAQLPLAPVVTRRCFGAPCVALDGRAQECACRRFVERGILTRREIETTFVSPASRLLLDECSRHGALLEREFPKHIDADKLPRMTAFSLYNTLDRKSTRLNSSHPSISYAVFCLKKK